MLNTEKKKLNILLVNPIKKNSYGFTTPPIGLTYLTAAVKDAGHNIYVYDMQQNNRDEQDLFCFLKENKMDVIGISIFSSMHFVYGSELNRKIKKGNPSALYVAGGVHPTVRPRETLIKGNFDIVVMDEGENTFIELLNNYQNGLSLKNILGTAVLKNGELFINPPRKKIINLDDLPLPNLEIFGFPAFYTQFSNMTARGCPHACKFCGSKTLWNRETRYQSSQRIMTELKRAVLKYEQKSMVFVDDTMNLNLERFNQILDGMIKFRKDTEVNFEWSMNSRVSSGKLTNWDKVYSAGGRCVSFGIEAGSDKILKNVDKCLRFDDIINTIRSAHESGLRVRTTWIVGLPGDYHEQLKSIPLMEHLAPFIHSFSIHNLLPLPGTPYGDHPKQFGINFEEETLLNHASFNEVPPQDILSFDYLSFDEMLMVFHLMEKSLIKKGFKTPNLAKPGDRIIRTPINRKNEDVEAIL